MDSMHYPNLSPLHDGRAPVLAGDAARALSNSMAVCLIGLIAGACATSSPPPIVVAPPAPKMEMVNELEVTATAYNSVVAQTDSDPTMTAHGVRLKPGMQVIAVSRDLEALGLGEGVRVRIEGLPGEWTVVDRMARRWQRRIDVYMGLDIAAALEFGRREVDVRWTIASN